MAHKKGTLLATAAAVVLLAAACSSSSKSGSSTGATSAPGGTIGSSNTRSGSGGQTYTIGVITDVTGPGASGNKTTVQGAQAGGVYATRNGITFKFVVGDDGTSPTGALTAAQKLVQQDHVFAVVLNSAVGFGATTYLTAHNIPVVGAAEDANEWITAKNMFSTYGAIHTNQVNTTAGLLFKMLGATTVGVLGYSISPSSSESAKATAESAKAVGLKVGYVNASFPFGSTNVAPIALAMKTAGVDAFYAAVDPNTGFALITALRQAGVPLKVAFLPTGYGADTTQAGPGALQEAQNVYFGLGFQPVELNTPATQQFQSDLKAAGVSGEPTAIEYNAYTAVGLLVRGLKAAGAHPTQASVIAALSQVHDWNALGLYGNKTLDINDRTNIIGGVDNCEWYAKLVGTSFELVPGAEPICGQRVPGITVTPSS
jgi:ABC-type branched-subunit amino acid transport system substrate-binding protein